MECKDRFQHLRERLSRVCDGKDDWIQRAKQADVRIKKEVIKDEGCSDFCRRWLALIEKDYKPDCKVVA